MDILVSMRQSIQYMCEQLQGLYPDSEIRALSHRVLESLCQADWQTLLRGKGKQLSANDRTEIRKITEELKKYRPLQYILGETEFYGLPFRVNEQVLIPRPETEELAEWILHETESRTQEIGCRIWDIGTGSGCIAVALAKHLPEAEVYASDISWSALETAKQNAGLNKVNIRFFRHDIFSSVALPVSSFDIIVSNPPYITPSEKRAMAANVLAYEPHQALFVPEDRPLLFYERIANLGQMLLNDGGRIFFETNALFGQAVVDVLRRMNYQEVTVWQDISGKDRVVRGVKIH
jgi:release factor glutamine methyltransferase